MNIAEAFPARRQPDGTTWYRSGSKANDGWSSNIEYAHPDYRAPGAPEPLPYQADPWPSDKDLETHVAGVNVPIDATRAVPSTGHDGGHGPRFQPEPVAAPATSPTITTITTTTEESTMTALTEDFETFAPPRWTQWMHYPLPPAPPRATIVHGQWGWYRLPDPVTGRPTGYPRATTIAETLDDHYGLNRWKRRETARRIYQLAAMPPDTVLNEFWDTTARDALWSLEKAIQDPKVSVLDEALDVVDELLGGAQPRELGECVHAWIEALALGTVLMRDVPDLVRPHITAARAVMAHRGIIAVPEYVERVILNERGDETVAGRIDCIWKIVTTGDLVLGDVKTSATLDRSWLSFGVQVGGVYGWATKVLSADGKTWEPMPKLAGVPHASDHTPVCSQRRVELWPGDVEQCPSCGQAADAREPYAILLHVPRDEPEHTAAITINQTWSGEVFAESLACRTRRKQAKNEVPKYAIPSPSDEALRIVAARLALSEITSLDDGQAVYETYSDVWNDDLGEFAETIAGLF